MLGLARVPLIVAVAVGTGDAVAIAENAVQDHVVHAFCAEPLQNLVQVGGMLGKDVDGLVQMAVAGGLGDVRIVGQAVDGSCFAEPAQGGECLMEWSQSSRALGGASRLAVCSE